MEANRIFSPGPVLGPVQGVVLLLFHLFVKQISLSWEQKHKIRAGNLAFPKIKNSTLKTRQKGAICINGDCFICYC